MNIKIGWFKIKSKICAILSDAIYVAQRRRLTGAVYPPRALSVPVVVLWRRAALLHSSVLSVMVELSALDLDIRPGDGLGMFSLGSLSPL